MKHLSNFFALLALWLTSISLHAADLLVLMHDSGKVERYDAEGKIICLMKAPRFLTSLVSIAILCPALQAADLHVATGGSDDNPGTRERPLATLVKARELVREALKSDGGDITVYLAEGTYRISETLILGQEDGAPEGRRVTWRNEPDEHPILSGGIPVTGWKKSELPGNIWVADLPVSRNTLTLYHGDKRLPRARGKGFVSSKQYEWHTAPTDLIEFPPGALKNYPDIRHAEIVARTTAAWAMNIVPLLSVDEKTNTAKTKTNSYSLGRIRHRESPPDSLWVENVLAELDAPGEWVVHPDEGKLYYWPDDDGEPGDVILPLVTEMIRVEGTIDYDGPTDTPVRGIHFAGLTFQHADRMGLPDDMVGKILQHSWDYFDTPNAMLRFRGAEDCSVTDCHFMAGGDNAIRLDLHAQKISIERSLFDHLGGAAVVLAGYGPGTKDVNKNNTFANNHVHHVSEIKWDRPAIFVWQSGENRIRKNLIHNIPYIAVSLSCRAAIERSGEGWATRRDKEITDNIRVRGRVFASYEGWKLREKYLHARNNLVEENEFFAVMERMGDGNAIYLSNAGGGNIIRKNLIHNSWRNLEAAIRCDDDQHETLIEQNLIFDTGSAGNAIQLKGRNEMINNFIVGVNQTPGHKHYGLICFLTYHPDGSRVERNVFYTNTPDRIRPIFAGEGRILGGTNQTVQQLKQIELRRSSIGKNLFWSPRKPTLRPLSFADAGGGWLTPWRTSVIAGLSGLDPSFALTSDAKGWVNTGRKKENNGAGLSHRGQWAVMQRDFAKENITTGVLWVSFLTRREEVSTLSDRSGIFFSSEGGEPGKGIFIGTRANKFGIGEASGFINFGEVPGNTARTTHLILARIDLDHKTVEAWFDPADVRSPVTLGKPRVSAKIPTIAALKKSLELRLEGQSTEAGMFFDALRIAQGSSSEAAFAALTNGQPASEVTLVSDDFDPAADKPSAPYWAEDYIMQAQADGYEKDSVIADPMFVNPSQGDFRFRPGSAALALGIAPLDRSTIGVDRSEWGAAMTELSMADADAALRESIELGKKVREGGVSANESAVPDETRDLHYIP